MTQQLLEPARTVPPSSKWTTPIRVTAAVLGTGMIAVGVISVIGYFNVSFEDETRAFTEDIQQVRVRATDGTIRIQAGSAGTGATVASHSANSFRKAKHTEAVSNGILSVDGNCTGGLGISDRCSIDFEITVPPGTVVDASTSTGNVTVLGTRAAVTAHSATGDLKISDPGSPVELSTDVGDVIGENLAGGDVSGQSNTGNVRFDFTRTPDRITARTDVGDVLIAVPDDDTSYQVVSRIDVGDAHIDVPINSGSSHTARLKTNTGDIRMGLN